MSLDILVKYHPGIRSYSQPLSPLPLPVPSPYSIYMYSYRFLVRFKVFSWCRFVITLNLFPLSTTCLLHRFWVSLIRNYYLETHTSFPYVVSVSLSTNMFNPLKTVWVDFVSDLWSLIFVSPVSRNVVPILGDERTEDIRLWAMTYRWLC